MKKLMSIYYSSITFNIAMLIIRLAIGLLMMAHGYEKLVHFNDLKIHFYNFGGLGQSTTLLLSIFAEFFCALFIIIGLFTRLVAVPLVFQMGIIIFKIHNMDFFHTAESATLYFAGFLVILLCGPGKASVDGLATK